MARSSIPENPYLAARQEWNERYGSYVKAAAAWRIVGITGMLMAVIGFSYALYQSTQVKLVPYIVEVDKLGTAATTGFPQQIEYADPRVVRATLGSFVSNFRSVTPDTVVQKQYIDRAYAHLRSPDPATEKVNAWFRSNSPFDRAREKTVAIEVTNIVPLANGHILKTLIPRSRLYVVRGGGHLFLVSRADEIIPVMQDFLDTPEEFEGAGAPAL